MRLFVDFQIYEETLIIIISEMKLNLSKLIKAFVTYFPRYTEKPLLPVAFHFKRLIFTAKPSFL